MSNSSSAWRLPRVDKWLTAGGRGLVLLSWESAVLLDQRLSVRARASRVAFAAGALAIVALGFALVSSLASPGAGGEATTVRWYMAASVLMSVGVVSRTWIVVLKESRLASHLTRRATDDLLVTLRERLGMLRALAISLVILADVAAGVDLVILGAPKALILTYGASLTVVLACSGLAARQLVRSPTIAVDQSSLAIDHRLRVDELMASVSPLVFFPIGITTPLEAFAWAGHHPVAGYTSVILPLVSCAFIGLDSLARARTAQPPRTAAMRSLGGAQ